MKLIFLIVLSFSIGWVVHILFTNSNQTETKPLAVLPSEIDCSSHNKLSTPQTIEKIVIKEVIKFVPKIKVIYKDKEEGSEDNRSKKDLFLMALEKNEFYNAMDYYQEADEEKHTSYQTALFAYFERMQKKDPLKTVEQMQYFIEIEPQSKTIVFQLAQLFEKQEEYEEALNLIIDFSYVVSYSAKSIIHSKIKAISLSYITKLKSANNFKELIDFLMNRINIGVLSDFYSFELAKVYLKIKKYMEAIEILESVQDNETYKEQAIEMLTYIQNKLEEQEEYPIQIPLIKKGLHFLVKVYVDNIPLLLLVDTGASTTSIDYNKINHLTVIEENAKFHTAGGDIYETIFQADTFTVGSTSFKNFTISSLQFTGRGQDGLLGMNFLGKFKFKIDQQEAILFLGEKN